MTNKKTFKGKMIDAGFFLEAFNALAELDFLEDLHVSFLDSLDRRGAHFCASHAGLDDIVLISVIEASEIVRDYGADVLSDMIFNNFARRDR